MLKPIDGFENYLVNENGEVFSVKRNIYLKPNIVKGYAYVMLYKNGKGYHKRVHRLVADAFIPNPYNYEYINHKDEDKLNNCKENLEWCNSSYNNSYGTKAVRARKKTGKKVYQFDMNGEFIKEWDSCRLAESELGLPHYISACARGERESCGGFLWRYE